MYRTRSKSSGALYLKDFIGTGIANEKRREARIPCDKEIAILPCASEKDWSFNFVTLSDCSPHGIGLIAEDPMKLGEQFLVKLIVKKLTILIFTVIRIIIKSRALFGACSVALGKGIWQTAGLCKEALHESKLEGSCRCGASA